MGVHVIEFSLDARSGVSPYLQVVHQVRRALRLGAIAAELESVRSGECNRGQVEPPMKSRRRPAGLLYSRRGRQRNIDLVIPGRRSAAKPGIQTAAQPRT